MVKRIFPLLLAAGFAHAELKVSTNSFDINDANVQKILVSVDSSLSSIFHSLFSIVGPGMINTMAQNSIAGVARVETDPYTFLFEPAIGVQLPGTRTGTHGLNGFIFPAANIQMGYSPAERTQYLVRGVYVPTLNFPSGNSNLSVNYMNAGVAWTRTIVPLGNKWYSVAVHLPMDAAFNSGAINYSLSGGVSEGIEVDPDGEGSATSASGRLNFSYTDSLSARWMTGSFTSGFLFTRPFLYIFEIQTGYLASLHYGTFHLTNTATGKLTVTASASVGSNVLEYGDTADISLDTKASFLPNFVSHNFPLTLMLKLWVVRVNLTYMKNLTSDVQSILINAGFVF